MTGGALGSGEARGDVVGHVAAKSLRADPGGLMAAVAIRVCRGEIIVVADMAIGARGNLPSGSELMRAGEWPARGAVVEDGGGPCNGVVARGTIHGGERGACGGVRGVVSLLPGSKVASGIAAVVRLGGQSVIAPDVTSSARTDLTRRSELVRIHKRE